VSIRYGILLPYVFIKGNPTASCKTTAHGVCLLLERFGKEFGVIDPHHEEGPIAAAFFQEAAVVSFPWES
jgi:hypothetical protein